MLRVNEIPNDGIIRYFGMFNQERILICSPKAMSEVLVTNNYAFSKPSEFRWSIGRILGVGILLAEGDEHKMQRRNLMPAFAFRHVKNLYPVFWQKAREVTRAMSDAVGDADMIETAVSQWASRCTLDIIGVAGMGKDFGAIQDPKSPLAQSYEKVFRPSKQAQFLMLLSAFLPMWLVTKLPLKRNQDLNAAAEEIRSICRDLIREKKAKLANKEQPDVDILSVALESGLFSDENLVDQLMTFLVAGHETTAAAMTWAVYMLCRHPEVQRRLRDEVRERLPSIDSDVDVASVDIDRMPYLNAVCNEVLRYYAPVPLTFRVAAHDTTIVGHPVRRGTRIIITPWATNYDRSLWGDDAAEFKPERWLQPAAPAAEGAAALGGASSNFAFLTFLHGPRSCIGQSFAKAEFACLLAAWIGRLGFELKDQELVDERKMEVRGGATARPAKGLDVKMRVVEGY